MELQEEAFRDQRDFLVKLGVKNERVDEELRKLDFILRAYAKRHEQPPGLRFMQELAADVDTLNLPSTAAEVHRGLAQEYASKRRWQAAYWEMLLTDSLVQVYEARSESIEVADLTKEREWWTARQDSIHEESAQARAEWSQAWSQAQRQADNWKWTALVMLGLFVLAVAFLLYRAGSTARRRHATIAALREELEAVRKERPEQRAAASLQPPYARRSQAPAAPQPTVDEAMRPVALGMFRKGAPERLATLRDARQRGDTEKVMRVVATLKPLLTGLDRDRSAALMARLRMPEASDNLAQWNADLDALETVLREQEAQGGGH